MVFENVVKNIQAAAYNGARTVLQTFSTNTNTRTPNYTLRGKK
jgi:hypothetical protein